MDSRLTAPTVTVLTPRGRSAVAVVSVHVAPEIIDADPPLFRAANGRSLAAQPIDRVCFGRWGADPGEEIVVCRITTDLIEISCHGGSAAVARIVRDLGQRGCRSTAWQDVLRESYSPIAAECLEALTRASTFRTAAILLEQSSRLLELTIAALFELDSPALLRQVNELLRWTDFGRHLTQPWQVVLTGLPNVGKSSLINQLVGYQRSIVYAEPGTTRDVVTAAAVFDGWPVELSDTAGLRDASGEIEAEGINRARQQLASADLAIIVLDRSRPLDEVEHRLIQNLPNAIVIEHKADLACVWTADRPHNAIAVSSLTGDGIDELISAIATQLVPAVPSPGTALPVTDRQITALTATRAAAVAGDIKSAHDQLRKLLGTA
jgi:tRNA modification GTPase